MIPVRRLARASFSCNAVSCSGSSWLSSSSAISASSAAISSGFGRLRAMRRDRLLRTVRLTARFAGEPLTEYPARCQLTLSASVTLRLARSGSSRSSRNRSTNSSWLSAKRNSSCPSPSGLPSLPPRPPPLGGRAMVSPSLYSLLPGNTYSRVPPWRDRRKLGSCTPCTGSFTSPALSASLMLRSPELSCTALRISAFARRMKRWRLPRLFPPGLRRRSTMYMLPIVLARFALPRLFHTHIPLHQPPDLALGVAARRHALDELAVLLLRLAVLLRAEADDRQQFLDLAEHPPLDDFADLLVACPVRIAAVVVGARPQAELHHLVAEVLRVGDPGRLLDFGELLVQQLAVQQLPGIGVLEVLILDPRVGVGHVAVEQVLPVVVVALQIRLLDLVADELGVTGREVALDRFQVALLGLLGELLAADRLLQHVHQVNRVGGDFRGIVIERRGQGLESKPRRDAVHPLIGSGGIAVFLDAARARVGFLQALAVIDAHLRVQRRVLVLAQPRQHREAGEHLERRRRARRARQLGRGNQLLVDLLLLLHAQAVRHLDYIDAVDEGFVVSIVLEALPLRLVGVGHDHARERDRADVLGADVVAFLGRGQQRVQHLDRRLEHLDELEDALVCAVEAARIAVGVRVVLRVHLQLADVDLADQRADVLVVLVARLRLRDGDLALARRTHANDAELADVAAEFVEPLEAPRAHQAGQAPVRDAVAFLQRLSHGQRIEQAERAFEHRADVVARLQRVDRVHLHQRLQPLGQRRLAAADGAKQVEDLLALLQALRCVAEEADDPLDRLFHAVELGERRIDPDGTIHENAAETRVLGRIDHLRLADRREQTFRRRRVRHRVVAAQRQVLRQRHLRLATRLVGASEGGKKVVGEVHLPLQFSWDSSAAAQH